MLPTCASSGHVDSGPYLGITGTWILSFIPGPHLDLVIGGASCVIAVDSFWGSPGTGDSDPNWASPRSSDSGLHLWTIMTWILCSTPEPHLDMMTLDPLW